MHTAAAGLRNKTVLFTNCEREAAVLQDGCGSMHNRNDLAALYLHDMPPVSIMPMLSLVGAHLFK